MPQMADLGCQDTARVNGDDKEVLGAILLWDGLVLAILSMDKGKCNLLECISGWFGVLKAAPRATDG